MLYRGTRRRRTPARAVAADLRGFHWDDATFKVDWALSRPIPWQNPAAGHGRHRAPRLGPGRPDRVRLRTRPPDCPTAVPAAGPDDDGGPDPLTRGHRVGLGIHPRAARPVLATRRRAATPTAWSRSSNGTLPASPAPSSRAAWPAPPTSRTGTRTWWEAPSTPAPQRSTSSSSSGHCPVWAGPTPHRPALPGRRVGPPGRCGTRRSRRERRPRGDGPKPLRRRRVRPGDAPTPRTRLLVAGHLGTKPCGTGSVSGPGREPHR